MGASTLFVAAMVFPPVAVYEAVAASAIRSTHRGLGSVRHSAQPWSLIRLPRHPSRVGASNRPRTTHWKSNSPLTSMNSSPDSAAITRDASPRTTAGRRLKKSISRSRSDCPTLPHFPGSEPHQGLHRSAWMRYIQLHIAMSSGRRFRADVLCGGRHQVPPRVFPTIAASGSRFTLRRVAMDSIWQQSRDPHLQMGAILGHDHPLQQAHDVRDS